MSDAVSRCLTRDTPRATAFIVTIYGDVAAPRGGILWIGTLIDCCAVHGISESLVRTAVSRLVEGGRLIGDRIGRKSYYRLTKAAEREFSGAATLLYAPPPASDGFLVAVSVADVTLSADWVRIGPDAAIAPDRPDVTRPDGALLATAISGGTAALIRFSKNCWPLENIAAAYNVFLRSFGEVDDAIASGYQPDGSTALALRLRLIHAFRAAALADPRLPPAALPADWPAPAARAMFMRLYLALAEAADSHIGRTFSNSNGRLPAMTTETAFRLERLRAEFSS